MALVGIDLGTTNSAVALWRDGAAELVENPLGDVLTPSVVGVGASGELIIGEIARDRLVSHPDQTVSRFKRWMGSDRETHMGRARLRPEDLSAMVLKSLRADLAAAGVETVDRAVISVPAYFSDPQRKATLSAARLAGLPVERLVNEPTAAALAYGLQNSEEGKFVVLDLGGGTFDVTVLDKYSGLMEVLASAGDNTLGGEDFTNTLAGMLLDRHDVKADDLDGQVRGRLRRYAEALKRGLSTNHSQQYSWDLGGRPVEGRIDRESFEEAAHELTARLRAPIERAIRDCAIDPQSIDQVILVGGATRMPLVRRVVSRLFRRLPLATIDPDTVVAKGAATLAAMLARDESLEEVIMTDVCPYTLGTAVLDRGYRRQDEVMSSIIERNAVVPVSRQARYWTAHDRQNHVTIDVYQGEQLRPRDNVRLGELTVPVPPGPEGKEAVDVRFTYDSNGILEVEVTVVSTEKSATAYFQDRLGDLSEQELADRFAALSKIKLLPREQFANRSLISRAERLFSEADPDLREVISRALSQFLDAIERQDNRRVDEDRDRFGSFLSELETRLTSRLFPDDGGVP